MKLEVEKLSLRELDLLVIAAERRKKLLATRRPLAVVRRELIALAASHGYAIEDVLNVQPTAGARKAAVRRKLEKAPAKYRDPENKRNTWSGRGRMPRWLVDRTKRGQSVADFLIPGLGRPTAKQSNLMGRRSIYKQR